ncbi:MAG: ATP-grasp domain-containing protein [Nitritalea sp.]
MENKHVFLCISNFYKGSAFLKRLSSLGNTVYLITSEKLREADWPHEHIAETFYMPGQDLDWNMEHLLLGVADLMRRSPIHAIVALDDYDVEKATYLRENLRIPGMGQTTGRYFRDKLAMRMRAHSAGIRVPAFSPLFVDAEINRYVEEVQGPWVLKPRSEASANGIIKVHTAEELWEEVHRLGENRIRYLVEAFRPGDVYHVDSLLVAGQVKFVCCSRYLATPMEISQGGGIFRSANIRYGSEEDKALKAANKAVLKAFGLKNGAAHTEFILNKADGQVYFLETSSRVGGAHLAEMVEAATEINLWEEWAVIEDAIAKGKPYALPKAKKGYAGIVLTLSKYAQPDLSAFDAPEVCFQVPLAYHAGLIVRSPKQERVLELLDRYAQQLQADVATVAAPEEVKKFH